MIRSVTAGAGGWAGDGTVWDGDAAANAPKPASAPNVEVGSPIAHAKLRPEGDGSEARTKGFSGIMRVTGADSSRRFDLRLVLAYAKHDANGDVRTDWQEPVGPSPPTPPAARDIGDGEDFTTAPFDLPLQDMAFHLVPQGGNLASGSVVEIWAAELD